MSDPKNKTDATSEQGSEQQRRQQRESKENPSHNRLNRTRQARTLSLLKDGTILHTTTDTARQHNKEEHCSLRQRLKTMNNHRQRNGTDPHGF
ncbi:hypothetical protein P8452_57977 [Trifolium repens]|nr:hypothetical protein QL285_083879 [Trifolium repens]WJX49746.1 hypothetical protein P8452_36143 [Trifolium repens]WJX74308.1 hypothetical protein P8452_57977 [Trifolium repens]